MRPAFWHARAVPGLPRTRALPGREERIFEKGGKGILHPPPPPPPILHETHIHSALLRAAQHKRRRKGRTRNAPAVLAQTLLRQTRALYWAAGARFTMFLRGKTQHFLLARQHWRRLRQRRCSNRRSVHSSAVRGLELYSSAAPILALSLGIVPCLSCRSRCAHFHAARLPSLTALGSRCSAQRHVSNTMHRSLCNLAPFYHTAAPRGRL